MLLIDTSDLPAERGGRSLHQHYDYGRPSAGDAYLIQRVLTYSLIRGDKGTNRGLPTFVNQRRGSRIDK